MTLRLVLLWQLRGRSIGVPSPPPSLGQVGRPYSIHSAIFLLVRHYLAEIYGVPLLADIFGREGDALLPLFGYECMEYVSNLCIQEGHAIFILSDWTYYDIIIPYLSQQRVLCVIIAPVWEQHDWYGLLLRHCSHLWFFPSCPSALTPLSGQSCGRAPWEVFAAIVDFRSLPASPVIIRSLPTIDICISLGRKAKPCDRVPVSDILSIEACRPASPFRIPFLRDVSLGVVPQDMRSRILDALQYGFASGYQGGSFYQRDFSHKLIGKEEDMALERMMKEVKKGFCLGPFRSCPFPSSWCSSQAIISQLFFIPKHKFIKDSGFRLIANRSFPEGRSFNDLVPRRDSTAFISDYSYFSFQSFIEQIRRLGPRSLISLFDVKDAYKNCKIRPGDLWQQVYRIGDRFFVDLGGMFGSRNAGDSWNLLMEFIALCLRSHCSLPEFRYFVDNGVNVTQAVDGKESIEKAEADFDAMIDFLSKAGVPFHDTHRPSTRARFLGWIVDTVDMKVSCTPERLAWVQEIIKNDCKSITREFVQSIVGLLRFLATVLPFLRAPLGWLQMRDTEQEAGREECNDDFRNRFKSYFKYISALLTDWKGSASIYASVACGPPDLIIYSDASGDTGYGALDYYSKRFIRGIWSRSELLSATRVNSVSSTHLEILAMTKAIRTFALRNSAIQIFSDSLAAICIMQKRYDRNSDLSQGVIIALDRFCRDLGASLFFTHVPRDHDMIRIADSLSKDCIPETLRDWEERVVLSLQPMLF